MTRKILKVGFLAGLLCVGAPVMAHDDTILKFRTMVGVDGAFLGSANPIRGVNGGGLPWVLDKANGKLEDDGELKVRVKGLIIPDTEPGFGFNPAPFFRAIVSCISVDETGMPVIENVSTDNGDEVMIGNPRKGNAKIDADVDLPEPCVAPIIFVTSPDGSWFSVTGAGSLVP